MDIVKNNCGARDIFDFSERHSKKIFFWGGKKMWTRQRRLRETLQLRHCRQEILFPFNNIVISPKKKIFLCASPAVRLAPFRRFTSKRVENAVHVVSLLLFTMETDGHMSVCRSPLSVEISRAPPMMRCWCCWPAISNQRGSRVTAKRLGSASNPGQRVDRLLFNAQSANDQKGKWENQTKTTYFDFLFSLFVLSFSCVLCAWGKL